ncbi:MAG: SBBP repeat-containing protein [Bacteroidetes bacterium]|nr:SBBP repeat-containing protein [Bacteroidota bacterium]
MRMKVYKLAIIGFISLTTTVFSQSFGWANQFSNINPVINFAVTTDKFNNVYTTGLFHGTADFDSSPGQYTLTAIAGDVFVQKSDSAGNFIWAKQIGGTSGEYGKSIKTDNAGNVYICGYFQGVADFDPGIGTYTLSSSGQYDCFVMKLDAAGNFVWAKKVGGTLQDYCYGLSLDQNNNVIITGYFNSATVDFNPGTGVYNLSTAGNYDCFILKLDNSGNFLWAHKFGSTSYDYSESVTIDNSDNVIIAGYFVGTVDFDPGPTVFNLTSGSSSENAFILKLSSAGNFIWAKTIQSTGNSQINSVSCQGNNLLVGGTFLGQCDLDPSAAQYTLNCLSTADAFLAKYDMNGNFIFGGGYQSPSGYTVIESVNFNSLGDVYAVGHHVGVTDFDPSVNTYTASSLASSYDFFVFKLNTTGQLQWVFTPQGASNDYAWSMAVNKDNQVIYCGQFYTTIDFDPAPTVYTLTSLGGDAFVSMLYECTAPSSPVNSTTSAMLNICAGNTTTLSVNAQGNVLWYNVPNGGSFINTGANFVTPNLSAGTYTYYAESITCDTSLNRTPIVVSVSPNFSATTNATICAGNTYTLPSGTVVSTAGTYTSNLFTAKGCDSVIVTNLLVNQPNVNVTNSGLTISALATGATFQWYDCNLNQIIVGATAQTFTASMNGSYAVIVTQNGCQDTSVCTLIQNVGINELNIPTLLLYPNPTAGKIKINTSVLNDVTAIKIYSTRGELVFIREIYQQKDLEFEFDGNAGVYYIRLERNRNPFITIKIIKQ